MDCNDYQRLINRLHDGELPAGESAGVFHHLATCGACRDFFHALQKLDGEMNRIAQGVPAPVEMQAVSVPSVVPVRSWWNRQVAMRLPVFALLLCAIALGLFAMVPGSPLSREPESIYVTQLPTVVVETSMSPSEPRQ